MFGLLILVLLSTCLNVEAYLLTRYHFELMNQFHLVMELSVMLSELVVLL